MMKQIKNNYVLFGNPVNYSKSPQIHNFFANETGVIHNYNSVNVPLSDFYPTLHNFFIKYGQGANITTPFKQEAYFFCNQLTERAKIAKSVNTLKKINDKYILGENTDGVGLLSDLIRLNFIKKNYSVLIFGAGGAVRGVLFPLLSFGCSIFILNRTILNAKKIVSEFYQYGNINVFENKSVQQIKHFDLIINGTSQFSALYASLIPPSFICSKTYFYDMNYQENNTLFIDWCISKKASHFANGIGMLVLQAANSFFLWHNIFPKTDYIIDFLNKENNIKYQNNII